MARSVSSPTSPCEDVMKNLSLDAIQLCDREGSSTVALSGFKSFLSLFLSSSACVCVRARMGSFRFSPVAIKAVPLFLFLTSHTNKNLRSSIRN